MAERVMAGGRVAVIRAEDFYTPPLHRPADAWQLLPPAERVIAWYEEKQQRRLPRRTGILLGTTLYAQINHGRWIVDCPECASAQITSPADKRFFCVECLSGWFRVVFPDDLAAAEQAVTTLPVRERNWWHPDDDRPRNRLPQPEPTPKQQQLADRPEPPAPLEDEGVVR